jgi:hypothetical protein
VSSSSLGAVTDLPPEEVQRTNRSVSAH